MPSDMEGSYGDLMTAFGESTGGGIAVDIYAARWYILLGMGITVVYTLIYIKLMDWCAYCMAWCSIIAVLVSLVIGGLIFLVEAEAQKTQYGTTNIWLYTMALVLWVLAFLYCICTACNLRSLKISIAVIETAADYFA